MYFAEAVGALDAASDRYALVWNGYHALPGDNPNYEPGVGWRDPSAGTSTVTTTTEQDKARALFERVPIKARFYNDRWELSRYGIVYPTEMLSSGMARVVVSTDWALLVEPAENWTTWRIRSVVPATPPPFVVPIDLAKTPMENAEILRKLMDDLESQGRYDLAEKVAAKIEKLIEVSQAGQPTGSVVTATSTTNGKPPPGKEESSMLSLAIPAVLGLGVLLWVWKGWK